MLGGQGRNRPRCVQSSLLHQVLTALLWAGLCLYRNKQKEWPLSDQFPTVPSGSGCSCNWKATPSENRGPCTLRARPDTDVTVPRQDTPIPSCWQPVWLAGVISQAPPRSHLEYITDPHTGVRNPTPNPPRAPVWNAGSPRYLDSVVTLLIGDTLGCR